MSFRAEPETE